ncbi:type VI secretion system tube protein TssD [Hymenobacter terrenus]|uniref:type VI secretion system tube protein TssD n=1 Tax=Hymenobacter terrenus TaxID=1629124 RepID=UPI000695A5A8|nr:type VI secretion system tube protein TssD [Hymenobacter terrenus]
MASFYAELHVEGQRYPLQRGTYTFTQATNERGRVVAKVRPGLVELTLDVPDDERLLAWANTPYKPLPGQVVFFDGQGGAALETLSWEAGQCVGYREEFESGSLTEGAYLCHLTITAPQLRMQPGGPSAYVPPAPGSHGTPQEGLLLPPPLVVTPVAVPVAEDLAAIAARLAAATLGPLLLPTALTLGLILASSTPAHAPGLPHPPLNPDELRLRELVAQHAAGTLTPEEEAELIALLAKVKGIHVQKLSDLEVEGLLYGNTVKLPGFYSIPLQYTKRSDTARKALRDKFDTSARKDFLKKLGSDPNARATLKSSGLSDAEIDDMADGIRPTKYQVHHKLPLDDGGDNSFDNLVLIKNDPYHKSITNLQISLTKGMKAGDTRLIQWPTYPGFIYP